jgi:hypothetical protein
MVQLVRVLTVRRLMIILALAIAFLVGVATAVAYYATTGGHDSPVKTVTAP